MINVAMLQDPYYAVPFLFILAIIFGVLELASPIKNRAVNAIVAVAIALFTITQVSFVNILWSYLPSITWFFIIMFFIAFMMELFGLGKKATPDYFKSLIVQGFVLLVLFTVGYNIMTTLNVKIPFVGGGENLLMLLGLILIIGIFLTAYKFVNLTRLAVAQKEKEK